MELDLRDALAAQIASALAKEDLGAQRIAQRAYSIADALVVERDRSQAIAFQPGGLSLLDEPAPMDAELELDETDFEAPDSAEPHPAWLERDTHAAWDLDAHWSPTVPEAPGPGLRKTTPEQLPNIEKTRTG